MVQDVIVLTVGGQRAKYGAAKGIVETSQMLYPWITRDQVYAKIKIMKKRDREHEAPPATGGGATAVASLPPVLPHLYIDQSFRPSDETQKE